MYGVLELVVTHPIAAQVNLALCRGSVVSIGRVQVTAAPVV